MRHPALDLINSLHLRGQPGRADDDLADPTWRERYARRWPSLVPEGSIDDAEIQLLSALRTVLQQVVDELTRTARVSSGTLAQINAFVESHNQRPTLRSSVTGGLELFVEGRQPKTTTDGVARTFQQLVVGEGAVGRVKLCANPLCRWAFYDESRNRSRRWCDSSECGNVMKARAFRARKAGARAVEPKSP